MISILSCLYIKKQEIQESIFAFSLYMKKKLWKDVQESRPWFPTVKSGNWVEGDKDILKDVFQHTMFYTSGF